jgi:hypothetical protein
MRGACRLYTTSTRKQKERKERGRQRQAEAGKEAEADGGGARMTEKGMRAAGKRPHRVMSTLL